MNRNMRRGMVFVLLALLGGCQDMPERDPRLGGDVIQSRRPIRRPVSAPAEGTAAGRGAEQSIRHPVGAGTNTAGPGAIGSQALVASGGGHSPTGTLLKTSSGNDLRSGGPRPEPPVPKAPSEVRRTGLEVHARDPSGVTPLMRAAEQGQLAQVEALLARGAEVNARSEGRNTPLMYAVRGGVPQVVQSLAAKGADIEATNQEGLNALMMAAHAGNLAVVQALVGAGADVNAASDNAFSPLEYAVRGGHADVAAYLRAQGARE